MFRRHGTKTREPLSWVVMLFIALGSVASGAAAQATNLAPLQRLVVLQRSAPGVAGETQTEVDKALAGSVSAHVPGASLYVSPVPFEDVELAAGCGAQHEDADCMQRIAGSLGADWVLVRELRQDRAGRTFLTLVAHDGPQAIVTRRAVTQIDRGKLAPAQAVQTLVERLYPTQARGYDERPLSAPRSLSPANVVGWSSAAVGGGLLAAGITMGVLSRRDHDSYERAEIRSPADVDRARDMLDRSQQRARVANGLLLGGAGAGAAGALALLWKYIRPKPDAEQPVRIGVTPSRGGVKLSLNAAWRGGL
jgi:hypothetical protein